MNSISKTVVKILFAMVMASLLCGQANTWGCFTSVEDDLLTGGQYQRVEGVVWDDVDDDRKLDGNEPRMANMQLNIHRGGDNPGDFTTTTDSNGEFDIDIWAMEGFNYFEIYDANGISHSTNELLRTVVTQLHGRQNQVQRFCVLATPDAVDTMKEWMNTTLDLRWWQRILYSMTWTQTLQIRAGYYFDYYYSDYNVIRTTSHCGQSYPYTSHIIIENRCNIEACLDEPLGLTATDIDWMNSNPFGQTSYLFAENMSQHVVNEALDANRRGDNWRYHRGTQYNGRLDPSSSNAQQRIRDLGHMIGMTAVHEAGHTLGLVGAALQGSLPGVNRYSRHNQVLPPGESKFFSRIREQYIMNSGHAYPYKLHIYEDVTGNRLPGTAYSEFNKVNSKYLGIIQRKIP